MPDYFLNDINLDTLENQERQRKVVSIYINAIKDESPIIFVNELKEEVLLEYDYTDKTNLSDLIEFKLNKDIVLKLNIISDNIEGANNDLIRIVFDNFLGQLGGLKELTLNISSKFTKSC